MPHPALREFQPGEEGTASAAPGFAAARAGASDRFAAAAPCLRGGGPASPHWYASPAAAGPRQTPQAPGAKRQASPRQLPFPERPPGGSPALRGYGGVSALVLQELHTPLSTSGGSVRASSSRSSDDGGEEEDEEETTEATDGSAVGDASTRRGSGKDHAAVWMWCRYRLGQPHQLVLIVSFVILNAAYFEMSEQAFHDSNVNTSSVIVVCNGMSLVVAVIASFCLEGQRAWAKIFSWHHAWRFTGIAGLFSLSTFLVLKAFEVGANAALVATLGYLYLPVSALLSTCVFGKKHRRYGRLEWLSLAMMTLAAFGFILLRERCMWEDLPRGAAAPANSTGSSAFDFGFDVVHTRNGAEAMGAFGGVFSAKASPSNMEANFKGMALVVLAVFLSAWGSILAERIYKGRSLGLIRADDITHRFAVQKVHLDASSLLMSIVLWIVQTDVPSVQLGSPDEVHDFYSASAASAQSWFGSWSYSQYWMVPLIIGQGWCAGLVCKQFSTVVKSIVQTLSTIAVVCISDPLLGLYDFRSRALPSVALGVVLVLSSIIFQTGRINLSIIKEVQLRTLRREQISSEEADLIVDGTPGLIAEKTPLGSFGSAGFSAHPSQRSSGDGHSRGTDPASEKLQEACADTPASLLERCRRYLLMLVYIVTFVVQQLTTQHILSNFPIVSATMNLMTFVFGITLASFMTFTAHGCRGLRQAWDPWQIIRCLPIGILFGASQGVLFMAYAHHVPASIVTVLGFIYMPVAAIGKRILLNKFTMWLQWVALIIITIASMTFGFLQAWTPTQHSTNKIEVIGLWFVIISATLSAAGSLVMEKMLQGQERLPFYIQKVALDMGSILTSVAMFYVQGWLSERPMDAYWRDRPVGGHCDDSRCWGAVDDVENTCAGQACSCECGHGMFVNWGSWMVWMTLLIITARGWLKGEVTKSTSTLEVAIAESFAPILLYFIGQPFALYLEGQRHVLRTLSDWALNCVVFISPLSAMVYDVAESKMRALMKMVDDSLDVASQCCPLHTLLVILGQLESQDEAKNAEESWRRRRNTENSENVEWDECEHRQIAGGEADPDR